MTNFDFIALDLETANYDSWSICQAGLAYFKDSMLCDTWSSLVNPECYFDKFNIEIHGITPQMVKNALRLPDLHKLLSEKLSENVVVHHTHFDRTSISALSLHLNKPIFSCDWLDSSRVCRRVWEEYKQKGYGLKNIALSLGITQEKPHDALDDAITAGHILNKAIELSGKSLQDWVENSRQDFRLWGSSVKDFQKLSRAEPEPYGPLFGEVLVFTGALSITRLEAAKIAFSLGCDIDDSVTKKTTVLVVGDQDSGRLAGYEKSSKHRKAEELIKVGRPIKIIGENDFFSMINI